MDIINYSKIKKLEEELTQYKQDCVDFQEFVSTGKQNGRMYLWSIGSLNIGTGADFPNSITRIRSEYILLKKGDTICLNDYSLCDYRVFSYNLSKTFETLTAYMTDIFEANKDMYVRLIIRYKDDSPINSNEVSSLASLMEIERYKKFGVINNNSITPEKTTFFNIKENLFNGDYYHGWIRSYGENYYLSNRTDVDGRIAIVPIEPNKTYTIGIPEDRHNSLRIGIHNSYPIFTDDSYATGNTLDKILLDDNSFNMANGYTFTNDDIGKYLIIYVSNAGEEPTLYVNEGDKFDIGYIKDKYIRINNNSITPEKTTFFKSTNNLFDGEYINDIAIIRDKTNIEDETYIFYMRSYNNARICIIPIEPNETYTISFLEGEIYDRSTVVIYNNYPQIGYKSHLADVIIHDSLTEGVFKSKTFTNTSEGRFLVVYVSNIGSEPKMQIEKGDIATKYKPFVYIPSKYLPIDNKNKYVFSDNLVGVYSTNTIENVANPINAQTSEVIALYDNLQAQYPDYISLKEDLGEVTSGEHLYSYTFKPHKYNTDYAVKHPKIIITSGVHGNEKNTVYSTYNFFKKLCTEWRKDKFLEFFRFNVEFIVVPIVNPTGFNAHTRGNEKGIDLNRDFPHKRIEGDLTGLQLETQAMIRFLEKNQYADYLIDYHRMFFNNNMCHAYAYDKNINEMLNKTLNTMGRKWQKDYDFFPQEENHKFGYTYSHVLGSLVYYARSYGIEEVLLEMVEQIEWQENWSKYDDLTILTGTELLVNVLKSLIHLISA